MHGFGRAGGQEPGASPSKPPLRTWPPVAKPRPKPKAAARKSPAARRAQRSLLASRPALPSWQPEPHHVDILALALIAVGIFLGGVAYLHWAGGTLGDGAVRAMRFVLGALGYAVPARWCGRGGLILMRELRPPARPLRTGLSAWWRR